MDVGGVHWVICNANPVTSPLLCSAPGQEMSSELWVGGGEGERGERGNVVNCFSLNNIPSQTQSLVQTRVLMFLWHSNTR